MWRRRKPPSRPENGEPPAFGQTLRLVEAAKAALLSAVPGRRGPGAPLAEAVAGFEERLRDASACLEAWGDAGEATGEHASCAGAVAEARTRAERFRLEASPQGYEELYAALGDLIEPLDVFGMVQERFRARGS